MNKKEIGVKVRIIWLHLGRLTHFRTCHGSLTKIKFALRRKISLGCETFTASIHLIRESGGQLQEKQYHAIPDTSLYLFVFNFADVTLLNVAPEHPVIMFTRAILRVSLCLVRFKNQMKATVSFSVKVGPASIAQLVACWPAALKAAGLNPGRGR